MINRCLEIRDHKIKCGIFSFDIAYWYDKSWNVVNNTVSDHGDGDGELDSLMLWSSDIG